ncbi:M23 family metallopeptidase [Paraburkholderia hayleyella]|uniref:M23 family metallopeptidase n=1 Tax=Paraburkholderia hayleyella TaxID=2152889 RepID=UPI0015809CC3|nr:M23 family metallopeptidase [Paraburkholderia hayleyella]
MLGMASVHAANMPPSPAAQLDQTASTSQASNVANDFAASMARLGQPDTTAQELNRTFAPERATLRTQADPISLKMNHVKPAVPEDLRAVPRVALSLDESVLASMCQIHPSICTPAEPSVPVHQWSGRVMTSAMAVAAPAVASRAGSHTALLSESQAFELQGGAAGAGTTVAAGAITQTLHKALMQSRLPAEVRAQALSLLHGRVNAMAKAHPGDRYRIVYGRDDTPGAADPFRLTAFDVRSGGKTYRALWFVPPGQDHGDYYAFDGQPFAALPFAMPVRYQRISSRFGMRVHPITGTSHIHTGVDLAAPKGTPVLAAAPGIVEYIGMEQGGYGKYVVVRHASGYTTYYAHLSAFVKGLRVGERVRQGQRLGLVGSTGAATGPHLHFEVRLNNEPTSPLRLTGRFAAPALEGEQLIAFNFDAGHSRRQLAAVTVPPAYSAMHSAAGQF